ncbi:CLUMA_CG006352, isoform A [Clunio marinus]|uniref:CLUMA_CG006352, isoform A n=1 Tax=Clunio marinus TaxID=568069 RepID=A0A1J1HXF2_9DIPT|nr:CLUMA_CG006352, isoform A [Clunio marinus]
MNAHRLRKWNPIKIFMYLLLAICSLLVFWCQGALTMHLTPLDFSSLNVEHRRRNYPPLTELSYSPSASRQNFFVSLLRNSTVNHDKLTSQQHYQQQHNEYPIKYLNEIEDFSRRKTWHMRMRKKHARLEAHRKRRLLFQRILDQRTNVGGSYENTIENLKISANPKLNINNLKHIINQNIITQHNHNNNKLYIKNTTSNGDYWKEEIFDALHKIMANISVASNRSRRDSRYHHQHNMHLPSSSNPPSFLLNNTNINQNYHRSNRNGHRQRRRKYCSARDPRTLAFEAPTVFEGKIKSMTPDRQANFSATVEILKVYKQQLNFALPRQVRLQFSYKNTSECDIYREEFRHRGFVREELEQGKIYFLFVKQISLGNFTMIGQPIKKISRTAKDVEIGVNEKYGE